LNELLKKYWGFDEFRPVQKEIVQAVIDGKDTLAILPTGGGKSLCYQLPALYFPGITLVISPLVALMEDQVHQLLSRGISATYIHSGLSAQQIDDILYDANQGNYKLLYVAPERLNSELFLDVLSVMDVSLIAIDEAHCISQWGHDFRPAYRNIASVRSIKPKVPIVALTASAIVSVQEDIVRQLALKTPMIFKQSVTRDNLIYSVVYAENKPTVLLETLGNQSQSGIVYCRTRKRCEETALFLRRNLMEASAYHAGMLKPLRDYVQQKWTESNDAIVCATTAFGMGIDKSNVRIVAHVDSSENLESYYQEAGRAGRDGETAHAVLLYNFNDIKRLDESLAIKFPPIEFIKKLYQSVHDYLQIAVGDGLEQIYDFDVLDFVGKFKLELLPAINAMKMLQREGYWQWNESDQTKTIVQFTTDRATLEYLQKIRPKLADVTTTLLRLYGSIFHFPTPIDEFLVAKKLGYDKSILDQHLLALQEMEIITYKPSIRGGTLFLLQQRLPPNYVRVNIKLYEFLKAEHEFRTKYMKDYLENTSTCRSVFIAKYFGEKQVNNCEKCDICVSKQGEKNIDLNTFRLQLPFNTSMCCRLEDINKAFETLKQEQIIAYLRILVDEGWVRWEVAKNEITKLK